MQSHLFLQRLLGDAEYLGRHCRHCRDCRQLAALDQPDRFRLPASIPVCTSPVVSIRSFPCRKTDFYPSAKEYVFRG